MKKKPVTSQDMNALRWKNGVSEADRQRLKEISKIGLKKRWDAYREAKKNTPTSESQE